jgi:hypothetical protein
MHNDEELKYYALDFIEDHRDELMNSNEWKNLVDAKDEYSTEIKHFLKPFVNVTTTKRKRRWSAGSNPISLQI